MQICEQTIEFAAPISYSAPSGFVYDNGGNVTTDGVNNYAYDSEGRLCAVQQPSYNGGVLYRYIYDASGLRVAKGTFTGSFPARNTVCPAAVPGTNVTLTAQYLLNLGGEQVTELNGTGGWVHSNVLAGSHLDATYDTLGLHFQLADPLGTRRMQTTYQGVPEEYFQSLPFGDNLTPVSTGLSTSDDATEHHLTGKERDTESGNDYFGARYYASNMGRRLSPDWSTKVEPVPYAKLGDPQTLNLYAYVGNNPLTQADSDGHCWAWGWVCSFGQAVGNAFTGHCFFCTDQQLTKRTEERRQWLEQHAIVMNKDGSTVDWQKADQKTIDHWYGQSINADANVPKLPIPPIPPGMKGSNDFGEKMGWGTGDDEARERMKTLTKEELEKNGVTKDMAEKWRDFYKNEMVRRPDNSLHGPSIGRSTSFTFSRASRHRMEAWRASTVSCATSA